jgi:mono/diheme cytochrome c family protein
MRFIVGFVVGVVVVLAAQLLFLTMGGMPAAARNAKPLPLEAALADRALEVAIGKDASRPSPLPVNEANLVAGARVYRENCMVCHGIAGDSQRTPIATGMFPRPPHLLAPDKGVTDDPVGETYWKVRNGIRLTGMPSFEGALTDTELWQVSLLLLHANELPPGVSAELR